MAFAFDASEAEHGLPQSCCAKNYDVRAVKVILRQYQKR